MKAATMMTENYTRRRRRKTVTATTLRSDRQRSCELRKGDGDLMVEGEKDERNRGRQVSGANLADCDGDGDLSRSSDDGVDPSRPGQRRDFFDRRRSCELTEERHRRRCMLWSREREKIGGGRAELVELIADDVDGGRQWTEISRRE